MSYWVEDSAGTWLGDLASNRGIEELRAAGHPALTEFVTAGEAGAELVDRVIAELAGVPALVYIAEMMQAARPPVIITDGAEEV